MNTEFFLSHHFEISKEEERLFEKFLTLFIAYNSHTNLSAIRDEEGIVEKHFVDSLYGASIIGSYSPPEKGELEGVLQKRNSIHITSPNLPFSGEGRTLRLLDIGSGGGFPGIPLKIIFPEVEVTLLDSVGKKVKAMNHFITELGLANIRAIQERAEILAKNPLHRANYDFVVSRATAYMTDILTWAVPFLSPTGKIILYKMPSEEEERDRERITKKLGLIFDGMIEYDLAGKRRVILIFSKK